MGFGHFARSASKGFFIALALAFFVFGCQRDTSFDSDRASEESGARESEQHEGGQAHFLEAARRERFLASRHGFQFGIPKEAFSSAVTKMHAMERNPARARKLSGAAAAIAHLSALSGNWGFLGPQPIYEKANFTGSAIGNTMPMAGRLTSVAADSQGLIVA